ncbi:MAG: response regulator [Proteobacteria bacterium]|nr:response regulator [Pseudomonadota bacterium]MBI3497166.1 response regulator [Pseudomonadota bacterium]
MRVLLCDDDLANRELCRAMLVPAEMVVDAFADAPSAIEALRASHYDIVLMDVMMPGMSGIDATRVIRQLPGWAGSVPVIGITARVSEEAVSECLLSGMNQVLTKPIRRMELLKTVTELVAGVC